MIKFFRKIRQQLLTENKFSKYLLYAIGEITLVVIGILIALQLNNINEQSGIHKKQEQHLRLIKGEMINNLNSLLVSKEILLSVLDAERKIIALLELDFVDEEELSNLLRAITFQDTAIPMENGALNELVSSGGLKDIKNDSIRSILASWEGRTYGLQGQEDELFNSRQAIIRILNAEGSTRTIIEDIGYADYLKIDASSNIVSNKTMLKSTAFENAVLHHLLLAAYHENNFHPQFESDLRLLIKLINEELNVSPEK